MSNTNASAKSHFWALIAILVFAVGFGGGGSKYGMANLVVQLATLVALAFHRESFVAFWRTVPLSLRALVGLSLLLPALYLVPLPPEVWSALPGRDLMAQSLDIAGGAGWATASVEPIRTLLALTALIVPLAVLAIGWSSPAERLVMAGWIVVALALANLLIGVPQVLSAGQTALLYPENPMPGVLFGTFANRNSTGLFLVGALALAALLPSPIRVGQAELPARIAICVLLIVAIVLTRSRSALVIALLPLGAGALRLILARSGSNQAASKGRIAAVLASGVLAIGILGTLAVAAPGRVGDVIERFESDDNPRAYIWEDALYSADRFWPVGAGTGAFDDVFQIDESLENLTQRTAGRAHNDYLEVAIEAGLPGLGLIAGWLLLIGWLTWRARKSPHRWIAWSGGTVLLAVALQSITDYPLRNFTLLAFGGYALLLLARFGTTVREERP